MIVPIIVGVALVALSFYLGTIVGEKQSAKVLYFTLEENDKGWVKRCQKCKETGNDWWIGGDPWEKT